MQDEGHNKRQLVGNMDLNFTRSMRSGENKTRTGYNRKCGAVVSDLIMLQKLHSPHPHVTINNIVINIDIMSAQKTMTRSSVRDRAAPM